MEDRSQPLKSFAWVMGAIIAFSMMAISGREVGSNFDTFEIMLYRSLTGIVIVLCVAATFKRLHEINVQNMRLQVSRNIMHFAGQNLWFFALTGIPLSQLFAFEFSTPIWVAVFAPFFLKEKLTRLRLLSALFGFCGILLVARPLGGEMSVAMMAAILCAVFFAFTAIATKLLTRTQSTTSILFWLVILQAIFGLVAAGHDFDIAIPNGQEAFWLVMIGVCGLTAHFCLTMAFSLSPAIVVAPYDFLRLPLISIVAFFLYQEVLEWPVFIGAIIVFAANMINIRAELKRSPTANA